MKKETINDGLVLVDVGFGCDSPGYPVSLIFQYLRERVVITEAINAYVIILISSLIMLFVVSAVSVLLRILCGGNPFESMEEKLKRAGGK